jgi:hypothetical protein
MHVCVCILSSRGYYLLIYDTSNSENFLIFFFAKENKARIDVSENMYTI